MEILEDKPNKLNILTKREVERQLKLQQKKDTKELLSADHEKLGFFETIFSEKQSFIEDLIKDSSTIPQSELPEHFNKISNEISSLQKYVAASNIFLRSYDLQRSQDVLQELSFKSQQLEDELLPKKKFSFKNKIKRADKFKGDLNSKDTVDGKSVCPKPICIENSCGFFNRSNETLTKTKSEIHLKDVTLENLQNCEVYFKGPPSTLHLNNLNNCKIFSGPVSTSIFAENCENCILVIACQQLRLHESKNITIYLHVTSRAIMEDCKDISIAPYNWKYDGIEHDFLVANLNLEVNNWQAIDDFNWLSEKRSPNWKEIAEKERVTSWND